MPESIWGKLFWIAIGAGISWLLQQYRISRSEDAALVNEHIKDIEKLRDAAQDYWLELPDDLKGERAASARVRAAHSATTLVYPQIIEICGELCDDYKDLSLALYDVAMGGNFESPRTDIDPIRAIDTHDAAATLIHLLRKARRDVLSLSRLGKYGIDFKS